ncbi:MAG: hypothetical protein IT536_04395 [Hyphomicrobiales bacterium]|nr:hypothetical protein [Hyphomicrobiales bacterium]
MIEDRQEVKSIRRRHSPEPAFPRGGVDAGQWRAQHADVLGLPNGCPVKPLGVTGSRCWFLDPIGQVQCLDPPFGKGHILGLFLGDANFLAWAWPRFAAKKSGGAIDGYAAEDVGADLLGACAALGPWDSVEKVRGRGAGLDGGGNLLLHAGTSLITGNKRQPPGMIEGFVYPTRPALPLPWPQAVEADHNPARLLRPLMQSWRWARPEVDPHLLLGWIGAALVGGALAWRPAVYITGDKATGKSTLQALIKGLLGDYLIQAVDTTGAGIYQHIGNDSLAIAVDELEGEADVRKAKAVLKLARIAASGGLMLRGGDRHNPVEFRARSCFLFSSINTPPLEPQDLSRMALLRLHRLPEGARSPVLDGADLQMLGRMILRRLAEEWPRFPETLAAFRGELARAGMDGRGQDTFGALLACADLIEHEGWDEARLAVPVDGDAKRWAELMAIGGMAEFEDASENWKLCLSHLLSTRVDAWRSGSRNAVGKVLTDLWYETDDMKAALARSMLAQVGLGLVVRPGPRNYWLAVPNQNPLTRTLFEGSKWAGDVGASVWAGALRQSPVGTLHEVAKARVNGVVSPATLISLVGLYGEGGVMAGGEGDG